MHSGCGVTETSSSRARRRAAARVDGGVGDDPFAQLGLAPRPGLSDDDVRAAWRRVAAATHPDREDGGDPARFGAAAAAYVVLRTGFGRGEALADLGLSGTPDHRGRHAHRRGRSADPLAQDAGRHRVRREAPVDRRMGAGLPGLTRLRAWITRPAANWRPARSGLRRPPGRPGRLALPVIGVSALALVAVVISGWSPGVVGVLAGALTWLIATAGRAFSRRHSQRPF
jgi:curved DNA-binding protein CbpA